MQQKDIEIIKHLRQNARVSLADISRDTGMPISTVFDKLNKLQNAVIDKYSPLLNFEKLGYSLRIDFLIKFIDYEKGKEFLVNSKSVNSLYRVNNSFDFLAETIFINMIGVEDFLNELNKLGIKRIMRYDVISEIKKETFLTDLTEDIPGDIIQQDEVKQVQVI